MDASAVARPAQGVGRSGAKSLAVFAANLPEEPSGWLKQSAAIGTDGDSFKHPH